MLLIINFLLLCDYRGHICLSLQETVELQFVAFQRSNCMQSNSLCAPAWKWTGERVDPPYFILDKKPGPLILSPLCTYFLSVDMVSYLREITKELLLKEDDFPGNTAWCLHLNLIFHLKWQLLEQWRALNKY